MPDLGISLQYSKETIDALKSMRLAVRNKILRRAITKGLRPIRNQVKRNAPRRNGIMRRNATSKIKTYKHGDIVAGIVGIRHASESVDGKKYDPARVAHLVEKGHGGPHRAPAHPFVEPGFRSSRNESAQIIERDLAAGIEEAARGVGKK